MPIRAVIFDFGSVLVQLEDPSGRQEWEERLGLAEGELAELVFASEVAARASVGQLPEAAVWEHVAATFGLDDAQLRQLRRDFWAGDRLDAELVAFVRSLRPRYKTAILSNAWGGARQMFAQVYGLGDAVDTMVISAEEGVAKPHPRIYHIAVERLDMRPEEAVFVDDMAKNVEGARAVGMRGVHFTSTAQAIADVQGILDGNGEA